MSMTDLIVHIISPLVDQPEAIEVSCNNEGSVLHVIVSLASGDHEQITTFKGRIARAIRTSIQAAIGEDTRLVLEFST